MMRRTDHSVTPILREASWSAAALRRFQDGMSHTIPFNSTATTPETPFLRRKPQRTGALQDASRLLELATFASVNLLRLLLLSQLKLEQHRPHASDTVHYSADKRHGHSQDFSIPPST
jgi:hypothetical protein